MSPPRVYRVATGSLMINCRPCFFAMRTTAGMVLNMPEQTNGKAPETERASAGSNATARRMR